MSTATPEQRARRLLVGDLSDLSARITRTEEKLACDTMLDNGTTMRHQSDDPDVYEDVPVKFYDGNNNPGAFTPANAWTHSTKAATGIIARGNWYEDICAIIKSLVQRGRPAVDLIVANDVGNFLQEDPWIVEMMDNRRSEYGTINSAALTPFVTSLGNYNFGGRRLNILVNDGTFEDEKGNEVPFLADGSVIVTAPNCGKGLYGAVTQKEMDNQWHTHSGMRVPNHISTIVPPADETIVSCRPLFVPQTSTPWIAAKNVLKK